MDKRHQRDFEQAVSEHSLELEVLALELLEALGICLAQDLDHLLFGESALSHRVSPGLRRRVNFQVGRGPVFHQQANSLGAPG